MGVKVYSKRQSNVLVRNFYFIVVIVVVLAASKQINQQRQQQSSSLSKQKQNFIIPTTTAYSIIIPSSLSFVRNQHHIQKYTKNQQQRQRQRQHVLAVTIGSTTELPDSLDDAAVRAAEATVQYVEKFGGGGGGSFVSTATRCRIDFDTSVGDETFTLLKTSTEFMQKYVTAVCYAFIPGIKEQRQKEMMNVIQAKADLQKLESNDSINEELSDTERNALEEQYVDIINRGGRPIDYKWDGPIARIYFPDEGNAAYARQNWLGLTTGGGSATAKVPPCCEFSSCGGMPVPDISNDQIVFFFCPRAAESDSVERILQRVETIEDSKLIVSIFVNPNLVDMGVTGFGLSGRMLRERLIEPLQQVYYLRTLSWGALTRQWPMSFSVWQEDTDAVGGYKLIENLDRLPSNPEVEDLYDIANGITEQRQSGGFLDQFGDFVNGMMRL